MIAARGLLVSLRTVVTANQALSNAMRYQNRVTSIQIRCLARRVPFHEPEYGVQDETERVDPSEVKVPYVTEEMKGEIYGKFKLDPQEKTFTKLANEYKMNVTRVKAIVLLRRNREEMMKKNRVDNISPEETRIFELYKVNKQRLADIQTLKAELVTAKENDEKYLARIAKRDAKRGIKQPEADGEIAQESKVDTLRAPKIEERIAALEGYFKYIYMF